MSRVEIDGLWQVAEIKGRLRASGVRSREHLEDNIKLIAQAAHAMMISDGPRDTGELLSGLHIGLSELNYSPGGAGGGGYYEATIYAGLEEVPHLRFVWEGTGHFGPAGGNIEPSQGVVMAFAKAGEGTVFTRHTQGQRPQTEWWTDAVETAERMLEAVVLGFEPDF